MPEIIKLDDEKTARSVTATPGEIADVFAEWLRRYNEEPEQFLAEYPDDEDDYGTGCATYFVKLLSEQP